MLSVNLDLDPAAAGAKAFAEKHQITFPIAVAKDSDVAVLRAYQLRYVPFNVLIKADGTISKTIVGPVTEADLTKLLSTVK